MYMHPILVDLLFTASSKTSCILVGILNAGEALQKNASMLERKRGAYLGGQLKNVSKVKQEPKKLSDR